MGLYVPTPLRGYNGPILLGINVYKKIDFGRGSQFMNLS